MKTVDIVKDKRVFDIFIDESGNQGRGEGDFFTIAFISGERKDTKKAVRLMKKSSLMVKKAEPDKYKLNDEVKAGALDLGTRVKVLNRIAKANIMIDYITVNKNNLKPSMFEHKHISYNYYCKFVLKKMFSRISPTPQDDVYLHADNRTTKVKSGNSFHDFMFEFLTIQNEWECNLQTDYLESKSSYGIQCADFVSNAINYYYLTGNDSLLAAIEARVVTKELFPYLNFPVPEAK